MSLTPTPTNSMLRYTPLPPEPKDVPKDENYCLSTYIHHTFTLTDAAWHQLALALARACAHWSPHTALSDDGDALTFYPRFDDTAKPASDRTPPSSNATYAATYFTLTPALWLSTLARLCRTRPDRLDVKRWYALRIALLSSDWLDRLDDAHLDLIAQLGCFDELR
jgi:hypothetical protein